MLDSEARLLRCLAAAARRRGNAALTSTRLGRGSDPLSYALAGVGAAVGALYVLGYLDWPGDPERAVAPQAVTVAAEGEHEGVGAAAEREEVVALALVRLEAPEDVARAAAVCRAWRLAARRAGAALARLAYPDAAKKGAVGSHSEGWALLACQRARALPLERRLPALRAPRLDLSDLVLVAELVLDPDAKKSAVAAGARYGLHADDSICSETQCLCQVTLSDLSRAWRSKRGACVLWAPISRTSEMPHPQRLAAHAPVSEAYALREALKLHFCAHRLRVSLVRRSDASAVCLLNQVPSSGDDGFSVDYIDKMANLGRGTYWHEVWNADRGQWFFRARQEHRLTGHDGLLLMAKHAAERLALDCRVVYSTPFKVVDIAPAPYNVRPRFDQTALVENVEVRLEALELEWRLFSPDRRGPLSQLDSGFGLRPDKEGFGQQAVRTILEDLSWERGR